MLIYIDICFYKKIFDAFETKGDFDIIVNKIIDWLYEKTDNEPIVLMGHSMVNMIFVNINIINKQ